MASFFSVLRDVSSSLVPFGNVWKSKAPPKVSPFAWLAISGAILTIMDNLHKHNITIVNVPDVLAGYRVSGSYASALCDGSFFLWIVILSWFDVGWVSQNSAEASYQAWMLGVGSQRSDNVENFTFCSLMDYLEREEFQMF